MARTQFTFTFTNAQPGSVVSFPNEDAEHLYADATSSARLGRPLVLDSSNSLSVWSDAEVLTATTEDGSGNNIAATATRANTSVTTDDGTAGQNPFGNGGSSAVGVGDFITWHRTGAVDGTSNSFDFSVDIESQAGSSVVVNTAIAADWGYAIPSVVAAGLYLATLRVTASVAGGHLGVDVFGSNQDWLPGAHPSDAGPIGAETDGAGLGRFTITRQIPAGGLFDVGLNVFGDPYQMWLTILKVA